MNNLCEELAEDKEKTDDRVTVLENEVKRLRAENDELREYVNVITNELNNVIDLLNARYNID